jgi:hypothetical protein
MSLIRLFITTLIIFSSHYCVGQTDSIFQTLENLQKVPVKYLNAVENKIDKYSSRITGKTEKTLAKLSKWENKIQSLLEKVNPEAANNLFGPGKTTFTVLLQKLREGQNIADGFRAQYNEYRDKLNTSLKYLENYKEKINSNLIQPVKNVTQKMNELEEDVKNTEAMEQFIKERKKQLFDVALKYLGKNKYLNKINKEVYYYAETIKNYKEIFSDPKKLEQTATTILKKIPAFNDFIEKNSGLASLFGNSLGSGGGGNNAAANINYAALGYQSNASIVQSLQQRNVSGPSIQQLTQTNASALNSPLQELKNHLPGSVNSGDMPDFKPNEMKSRTFKQRIQFGTNLQFGKATNFLPGTADIGVQLAYKLNTKSNVGLGTVYKLGLGSRINNIKLSFAGIGLRSFVDWKLKGNFFINGGFEYNYNAAFKSFRDLPSFNSGAVSLWKPAALIGINKKYNLGKVKGNIMLLYDFLAKQKLPQTQSLVFRFGYNF